jgi:hypothetical protein
MNILSVGLLNSEQRAEAVTIREQGTLVLQTHSPIFMTATAFAAC